MLPPHLKRRDAVIPLPSELEPFIEPSDVGGHSYWVGDLMHEAQEPWPAFKRDGNTFIVMRVLLELKPFDRVKNTCGLRTCVNKDHWEVIRRVGSP